MSARMNEVADVLLVSIDGAWYFARRCTPWPAPPGKVALAGPYGKRERAVEVSGHPEWAVTTRQFARGVLSRAEAS